MAYKVNYGLERAERNRAKQAKKEAKLRDRKANPGDGDPVADAPVDDAAAPSDTTDSQ
jgi:hypothetical protein